MIGTILQIKDIDVQVQLSFDVTKSKNMLNNFTLFVDDDAQFIGEINEISKGNIAHVRIVGEYVDGKFNYGTIKRPSFRAKVYLLASDFIPTIIGKPKGSAFPLGQATLYDVEVGVDLETMFGSHFAIFGSTGSGKSCGFSRIIQNVFEVSKPKKARLLIFDAYGEYKSAFSKLPTGTFKSWTTNTKGDDELLKMPLWLMNKDDIALLLNATKSSQLLVIDKALRFVDVFTHETDESRRYKNSVIASALLEILTSGRSSVQIRDHVLSLLSRYNTDDLNAETKIIQPGYVRTIKQCMFVDQTGKINSIELVESKLQEFVIEDIHLSLPDGSYKYTLEQLLDSLDFALIDEGVWKSEETYDAVNFLKIRLQNLIKSDYRRYFETDYVTGEEFIRGLFENADGSRAQIVNCNINYIDDRFAKTVTKIYSRMIYEYAKDLPERASEPFNIILEEAHRYVQNDSDVDVIGYNIFERICKEGRKYGVLMGFISQRPVELSETCISQCANYFIFKMTHAKDLDFIRTSVPYVTESMINKIKSLSPGSALAFGKSFNMPVSIDFKMPSPSPSSENAEIAKRWY